MVMFWLWVVAAQNSGVLDFLLIPTRALGFLITWRLDWREHGFVR